MAYYVFMSAPSRTVSVTPGVLSYALCRASEEDAAGVLRAAGSQPHGVEHTLRAGQITTSLIQASVEMFKSEEFSILRALVSAYVQTLGPRPVAEGGMYTFDVIDAFAGYEKEKLSSTYVAGIPEEVRHGLRQHLRTSTYVKCWALIPAGDMSAVLETPWKDVTPFLGTSWVDAQRDALAVLSGVDWSSYENLALNSGESTLPPHESLIGCSAIEYHMSSHGGHRGDGNTRAHALIAQGATTVLVLHTRPYGTQLNGVPVSPEVTVL